MFGYIRPVKSELYVKDSELYSALYCGLCRYGGKNISHLTRWLLNYDFVLLALLRMALENENICVERKKCPYKLRKKNCVCADKSYDLVCSAFGILTYEKLLDDIRDEKGFKKFSKILVKPLFKHMASKADKRSGLKDIIKTGMDANYRAEISKTASLDEAADGFATMMKNIASFSMEGEYKLVAEECGYHIGRFIYIADAFDDTEDDEKTGNYNPILLKYGSAKAALEAKNEISVTLYDSLNAFSNAFAIACDGNLDSIRLLIYNIVELGGREAVRKIIERKNNNE